MSAPTISKQQSLVRELFGGVCRCGGPKSQKKTFCQECFYAVPPGMRKALYRHMGEGYEEAYDAAVNALIRRGRVKPNSAEEAQ